jgi:hypothetical protein
LEAPNFLSTFRSRKSGFGCFEYFLSVSVENRSCKIVIIADSCKIYNIIFTIRIGVMALITTKVKKDIEVLHFASFTLT